MEIQRYNRLKAAIERERNEIASVLLNVRQIQRLPTTLTLILGEESYA